MRYKDGIERTGWSLALGGACTGTGTLLVGWGSGQSGAAVLLASWLAGAVLGLMVIVGVGGPAWWLMQRRGGRGPVAAGVTGAGVAGAAALLAGLLVPRMDLSPVLWSSAGATALVAAFLGGLIALAMWLVRYRPV